MHPWQKDRIDREKEIKSKYGLKNKAEIWKANSELKRYTSQAKNLVGLDTEQSNKERKDLLARLQRFNLVVEETKVEEVLNLTIHDILDRRLQTLVFKKGLARSVNQARQFIVHGHIMVKGTKVSVPSYMVSREEEHDLSFNPVGSLSKEDHPERAIKEKKEEVPAIEETKVEEIPEAAGEKKVGMPEVAKEEAPKEKVEAEPVKEEKPQEVAA